MGLKAGLQILQKVTTNFADDAARLVLTKGDDVARAIATKTDDAVGICARKAKPVNLKDLRLAPEAIGDTVKISTKAKNFTCTINGKQVNTLDELTSMSYVDGKEMAKIFEKYPSTDPHLGTLPSSFFGNINVTKSSKIRAELTKILDRFSTTKGWDYKELQNELKNLLGKNVVVEHMGRGSYANVYKLTINGKKYAFKVFDNFDDLGTYGCRITGASVEPSLANFLNKNSDKCAKFYYGKIGAANNKGAYTLSEFLEGTKPGQFKSDYDEGILSYFLNMNLSKNPNIKITPLDANFDNLPIGGKFFDYGMLKVESLNDIGKDLIFHL